MTNEEAIFIINNRLNTYYCTDEDIEALNKAVEALKDERTPSKWIDNGQGFHFCKSCGYFALYQTENSKDYFEKLSNFCPHCGAKMREADNE